MDKKIPTASEIADNPMLAVETLWGLSVAKMDAAKEQDLHDVFMWLCGALIFSDEHRGDLCFLADLIKGCKDIYCRVDWPYFLGKEGIEATEFNIAQCEDHYGVWESIDLALRDLAAELELKDRKR
jgi:hypothetical protein